MTSERTKQAPDHLKDDCSDDLKILGFVLVATMVCLGFMLLAGASANAAASAWV